MTAPISLLTDFGSGSVYVGQMHAVLLRLAPDVPVVDLAHDCPAGHVEAAAYILRRSVPHFPPGTVHVVVVDPGVGTSRAVLAARTDQGLFVGPDNGALAEAVAGGEVRRVENRALMARDISPTFQGRDIMAPVAARLATGTALVEVGPVARPLHVPPVLEIEDGGVTGRVLMADHFGNLITNIPFEMLAEVGGPGGAVRVRIGAAFLDGLVATFADVAPGRALAYIGSGGHLEIAVNEGSAAEALGLDVDTEIRVEPGSR